MTMINTSHFKHLQHYRGTSIEDQPTHADMGDIFHLFTEDNNIIDYIFNGETWQLYTDKVDIGFDTSTPLSVTQTGKSTDDSTVQQSYEKDPQGLGVERVVIAAFPNLTLTHTTIQVATTSTIVLPANSNRKYLLIVNDSDTNMYLSFGVDAVLNEGIPVSASGNYELQPWFISTQAINCIHGGVGDKKLLVTEGV